MAIICWNTWYIPASTLPHSVGSGGDPPGGDLCHGLSVLSVLLLTFLRSSSSLLSVSVHHCSSQDQLQYLLMIKEKNYIQQTSPFVHSFSIKNWHHHPHQIHQIHQNNDTYQVRSHRPGQEHCGDKAFVKLREEVS